jgi:hypothetical protein
MGRIPKGLNFPHFVEEITAKHTNLVLYMPRYPGDSKWVVVVKSGQKWQLKIKTAHQQCNRAMEFRLPGQGIA